AAAAQAESGRRALEASQKEAQAKADKARADLAALQTRAKPVLDKEKDRSGAGVAAREASARLAGDLKKQLSADKDITVDASDDRIVLSVAQKTLFAGDDGEPGM